MLDELVFTNTCDGFYDAMDVHFTYACDNDCEFCIDKIYEKKNYKNNIQKMVSIVKKEHPDIMLILGGEPFIIPDLLSKFVNSIRAHVKELYITTTLPKTFILKKSIIENIIEKLDGLNISVQNLDWMENNKMLRAKSKHDRIEIMSELIKKYPDKIRININLVKNGIDSKEKLEEILNYLDEIGCRKVKINELQHTHKKYISYEKTMNYKWPSAYAHGCQTFLKYGNIEVLVKRACFITEWSNKATWQDILKLIIQLFKKRKRYRVLWGDGKLTNNWNREG